MHVSYGRTIGKYVVGGHVVGAIIGRHEPYSPEFFVEHVIVLPGAPKGALFGMIADGIKSAPEHGYRTLVTYLNDDHPQVSKLAALARRLKFEPFDCDDAGVFYRRVLRSSNG
jgi:hypothetical protein